MKPFILIPARGGSQGIPGKNIKLLNGKPLIAYSIEQGLQAKCGPVIVSTDDSEIAAISREFGAQTPFIRPVELSTSTAKSVDVMIHAAQWMRQSDRQLDTLILLQPTSPYRPSGVIGKALELFEKSNVKSLVSVRKVPDHFNPHWVFLQTNENKLTPAMNDEVFISRRQDLPLSYHRDGAIYIVNIDYMITHHRIISEDVIGYAIDSPELINIDSAADWKIAETYIR